MAHPHPLLAAVAMAALLGACAFQRPRSYVMGSSAASVIQGMGTPTGEYASASGGRRLEYAGGAYGRHTYMFDFDASDRLRDAQQGLTEARFNAIKAGMTSAEGLAH